MIVFIVMVNCVAHIRVLSWFPGSRRCVFWVYLVWLFMLLDLSGPLPIVYPFPRDLLTRPGIIGGWGTRKGAAKQFQLVHLRFDKKPSFYFWGNTERKELLGRCATEYHRMPTFTTKYHILPMGIFAYL